MASKFSALKNVESAHMAELKNKDGPLNTEDVLLKTKDGPSVNRKLLTHPKKHTNPPTHRHLTLMITTSLAYG